MLPGIAMPIANVTSRLHACGCRSLITGARANPNMGTATKHRIPPSETKIEIVVQTTAAASKKKRPLSMNC